MQKSGHMVLKGVNLVHIECKNQVICLERGQLVYTIQKSGHIVLKGVNLGQNVKIRSNGLERSQLGTHWVHNVKKSGSYGLERGQLGTQYKSQVI